MNNDMETIGDLLKLLGLFTTGALIILGAVVYLLKHMASKWIESSFAVKMKELEHQHKLLEQRENVKYAKTHEERRPILKAIQPLMNDAAKLTFEIHVGMDFYATTLTAAPDMRPLLQPQRGQVTSRGKPLLQISKDLNALLEHQTSLFVPEFNHTFQRLVASIETVAHYIILLGANAKADPDMGTLGDNIDELLAARREMEQTIREHYGAGII